MTDIPDIDFGDTDNDPIDLGRVNLTPDGSVYADIYSLVEDPFIGTGAKLDLSELYSRLGYDPRDELDQFIDTVLSDYNGQAISRKYNRKYFGRNQLRAKLEGMRNIWHYIMNIWIDRNDGDLLDVYIIDLFTTDRYA